MDKIISFISDIDLTILMVTLVASLIVIIIITALNTWVLVDCAQKEQKDWDKKNRWILIIAAVPFGWLAYVIFRRPKRIKQLGK